MNGPSDKHEGPYGGSAYRKPTPPAPSKKLTFEQELLKEVRELKETNKWLKRWSGWASFVFLVLLVGLEIQTQDRNHIIDDLSVTATDAKVASESAKDVSQETQNYIRAIVEESRQGEQVDPAYVNTALAAMLELRDAMCTQGIIQCPGG